MNAHCERVIRTLRYEFCDHVLALNQARVRHLLSAFGDDYNHHRPRRARNQLPPNTDQSLTTIHDVTARKLERTSLRGGLINEYQYTA